MRWPLSGGVFTGNSQLLTATVPAFCFTHSFRHRRRIRLRINERPRVSDSYHLPPAPGQDKPTTRTRLDPDIAKQAAKSSMPDGSIYDFDVPHRGSSTSIYLTIIVFATVVFSLIYFFFRLVH